MDWRLAAAKRRLSALVNRAFPSGLRWVCHRVYKQRTEQHQSFKDFLLHGPDIHDLDLERERSSMRTFIAEGVRQAEQGQLLDGEEVFARIQEQQRARRKNASA